MNDLPSYTRRSVLTGGAGLLSVSLAGCLDDSQAPEEAATFETATVHFDPACGCCGEHAAYLAAAGADVQRNEVSGATLENMRDELQIPNRLRSCHTTELAEGYVIEGHVPVDVINDVLDQNPAVTVIALPGMPAGSPGMGGSKREEWVFYSVDESGDVAEFTRR